MRKSFKNKKAIYLLFGVHDILLSYTINYALFYNVISNHPEIWCLGATKIIPFRITI